MAKREMFTFGQRQDEFTVIEFKNNPLVAYLRLGDETNFAAQQLHSFILFENSAFTGPTISCETRRIWSKFLRVIR